MILNKTVKLGLLTVLFLAPFGEMLNLSQTGYMFTVPKILMMCVVFLWLWNGLLLKDHNIFTTPFSSPVFISLLLLMLANFLSFVSSYDVKNSAKELLRLISLFILIISIADVFRDKIWFKRAIVTMLAASVIATSLGIYEIVSKKSAFQLIGKNVFLFTRTDTGEFVAKRDEIMMPEKIHKKDVFVRVQGPNSDPNVFAAYLITTLGLALSQLFTTHSRRYQLFLSILIILLILNIIFTNSRTGVAGMFIAIGTFLILAPYKAKKLALAVLFPLILIFPFVFINLEKIMPSYKIFHITSIEDVEKDTRIGAWITGLRIITLHPITGIGIGNFENAYLRYRDSTFVQIPQPVQNTFIKIWAEGGTIAMIFFIVFVVLLLTGLIRSLLKSQDKYFNVVSAGILSSLAGLIPLHITQENIWEQQFLWILFGLSVIIWKTLSSTSLAKSVNDRIKVPA